MALQPDRSKLLVYQEDVDAPATFFQDMYNLKVFREAGYTKRGVLEVCMSIQFLFEATDGAGNEMPEWTDKEKKTFVKKFEEHAAKAWEEKYRIKVDWNGAPVKDGWGLPMVEDVGVILNLDCTTSASVGDHFEITINKADSAHILPVKSTIFGVQYSYRNEGELGASSVVETSRERTVGVQHSTSGNQSVAPQPIKQQYKQITSAHEFGHMLGLEDEYYNSVDANGNLVPDQNPHYLQDYDSIMNLGMKVRPRHYAMLAYWLTERYRYFGEARDIPDIGDLIFYVEDGNEKWILKEGSSLPSGFREAKL